MNMRKKTVCCAVLAVFFVVLPVAYFVLKEVTGHMLNSPCMSVIQDSSGERRGFLYVSAMPDRTINLYLDRPEGYRKIGMWESIMWDIVWSGDDTVLTVWLNDYLLAYDFQNDRVLGTAFPLKRTPEEIKATSMEIETLLDSRGGAGLTAHQTSDKMNRLSYFEWKKLKKEIKKSEP